MDLSTIKVCIFDVNGVLIDSNRANARAMARSFTDDPATLHLIEELYLELTGIDRGSKIRIIQERVMRRPFEGVGAVQETVAGIHGPGSLDPRVQRGPGAAR